MSRESISSVSWEKDVYQHGLQLNRWPYSEVVSWFNQASPERDDRGSQSVLEIGFGGGNNLWFLADAGFKTYGLEISETAVKFAKEYLEKLSLVADLQVGNLCSLPYSEDTFDFVLDRAALTHNPFDDICAAVDEIKRVLKPGGIFRSFDLFGMNHPDRKYGLQIGHNCFDNFTQGAFKNVGLTTFFTEEDLRTIFQTLEILQIERQVTYDGESKVLLAESYCLSARLT